MKSSDILRRKAYGSKQLPNYNGEYPHTEPIWFRRPDQLVKWALFMMHP
jgi:hypothetical protein